MLMPKKTADPLPATRFAQTRANCAWACSAASQPPRKQASSRPLVPLPSQPGSPSPHPHSYPQFHPESVCTEYGATLLANFFAMAAEHAPRRAHNVPPAGMVCDDEEEQGQGALSCDGWRPRPGMNGLRVLSRMVQVWADAEVVYREMFRGDDDSYWLDTARQQSETGRFSFMGGSNGPLSYRLSYRVGSGEVAEWRGGGGSEAHKVHKGTRFLPFVEARLADAGKLPPRSLENETRKWISCMVSDFCRVSSVWVLQQLHLRRALFRLSSAGALWVIWRTR